MKAGISIIDAMRGTDILGKYYELQQTTRQNVNINEANQLKDLLLALKYNNNYYRALLSNYSDNWISSNPKEVLQQMPLMDKTTINQNYLKIFTKINGRSVQKKKTGGSTGSPFYYYVDKNHLSWFWAYIYFFWNRYSGYKPGDPFVTIAGNSLRTNNRRFLEELYHKLQNNYFIKGDIIDSNLEIEYRKTNKAKLLYAYPSSLINILTIKPDFKKNLSNLKAVFTTSEQLLPKIRKQIENSLGVPVFDMYGANDGGILTCECTQHNGYHINSGNCYVESFINEYGMNELSLTNLTSYSFPFVRYRVGDLGTIDYTPCECGLTSPKIIDLKGRTRDLIKLPDGRRIHGSLFNNIFYKYQQIDGYKIVQQKDLSINLFLHVATPDKYNEISAAVSNEMKKLLKGVKIVIEKLEENNPTNQKFKLIESHAL